MKKMKVYIRTKKTLLIFTIVHLDELSSMHASPGKVEVRLLELVEEPSELASE